jgi:DNA polymerase III alpha subunit
MVEAAERLENLHTLFPDRLYLEICRCGRDGDDAWVTAATSLSQKCQVPVVATNDVRFLERTDFLAHEVRVCIVRGQELQDQTRDRDFTEEQYLKSAEEMTTLFTDIPEAITNSLEIAGRCTLGPESMEQDLVSDTVKFMTARMVIRDVSRVLGHSYDYGDLIARRIPTRKEITIPKAISEDSQLQHDIEKDLELRYVVTVATALEGIAR